MNLELEIKEMLDATEEMVRSACWNKISANRTFMITKDSERCKPKEGWKAYFLAEKACLLNHKKYAFGEALAFLEQHLETIYLIEIYLFKSLRKESVFEIRLRYTHDLKGDINRNQLPLKHCKVVTPPYLKDKAQKFDVNWKFGTLESKIRLFLWRKGLV